jgi:hypothetical protein
MRSCAPSDRSLRAGRPFRRHRARLFRTIEGDPGDLTAARKYLSVYLLGARDATVKFADHYAQTRDAAARTDYEALLTDLETTFARRPGRSCRTAAPILTSRSRSCATG